MKVIRCDHCGPDGKCEYENVCMCGDPMDSHSMYSGHTPTSMHYYYGREVWVPNPKPPPITKINEDGEGT